MKTRINDIEFEGTPTEIIEVIRLMNEPATVPILKGVMADGSFGISVAKPEKVVVKGLKHLKVRLAKVMERYPNHWKAWKTSEQEMALLMLRRGDSAKDIAKAFGRKVHAIYQFKSRCRKGGLMVDPAPKESA